MQMPLFSCCCNAMGIMEAPDPAEISAQVNSTLPELEAACIIVLELLHVQRVSDTVKEEQPCLRIGQAQGR